MAILSTSGPNLTFQTPDLSAGASAFAGGIQAISAGLDRRKRNRELELFNEANKYVPPGDQYELDRQAQGGYMGPGDRWEAGLPRNQRAAELRKMQEAAAIRAKSYGVDTSGYENMRGREAAAEGAELKRQHELAIKQAEMREKMQKDMSPHDRMAINLIGRIKTDSDKAKAWDAYSSIRGIKGAGADLESMAGLVGDQSALFKELKSSLRPNATKAVDAIIQGNLAKGIPLSFAALAEAIGGSENDKLKFQADFQKIAQKHLDPAKLNAALEEIYFPEQREAYRQGMGLEPEPPQITEQQFEGYLNSMTDEQLAAFMKRMGMM